MAALPFLTLPDPLVTGEGALDPLGLAMIAERLADEMLPGLRARMARPRFMTAIAVSAAVCEGILDRYTSDGVTPAHLVFEWLLVEAFVRAGDERATMRTPGILKAREARARSDVMCARTYLKAPTVFGFHGVYKPLAQHCDVIDDELRLADRGYELLQVWQSEQGLRGFLGSANGSSGSGRVARQTLRAAVEESLATSRSERKGGWQGWQLLATHLAPTRMGSKEGDLIRRLLADTRGASRGEVFDLLSDAEARRALSEQQVTHSLLLPKATKNLKARLQAIVSYEKVCAALEEAFDWIRYLSTHAAARPVTRAMFAQNERAVKIAKALAAMFEAAESALADSRLPIQQSFAQLAKSFAAVRDAEMLFEAVLAHHERVQRDKPPEGKRSWFERSPEGATFVRPPYRVQEQPVIERAWNRPYRIDAVRSFLDDLELASHGTTESV